MKRVLNSGTIKLPYIKGVEKDLFKYQNDLTLEEFLPLLFAGVEVRLEQMVFTFEIKAPLSTFLAFQDSNLGTLKHLDELDHLIAYVPADFYKKDGSGFNPMESKQCNTYSTKLFNFYTAALNFHNNLLKEGLCKEQADLVLPQGVFINFLWEINLKDLIDYIDAHHTDSPETYGYCAIFVLYLEEHAPIIARWLKQNRWQNYSL